MRKSKISKQKQNKLIELFVAGTTARCASAIVEVNKTTAAYFFKRLRELILEASEKEAAEYFDGEIEVDESYFGGVRKGKRGRGAGGKVAVFGLLKRKGKVFAKIIPNAKRETIMPIIHKKIVPDSIVYTDTFKSYEVLDTSGFRHHRINHSKLFADKKNHINGIENFWNQAKRHMRKFNGINRGNFIYFLKECEWRFNHPDPKEQIAALKQLVKQRLR